MNERFESPSPLEPSVIDRLVDGELTDAEEQTLLAAIEFQPDGWRRCALAFLEARAWRDEMSLVARGAGRRFNGVTMNGATVAVLPTKPGAVRAQWTRIFAVAACVGLAFFLGMVVRGPWTQRGNSADNQLAAAGRATQGDSTNLDDAGVHFTSKPSITLAVVDNQGDVERQFELPVVEADRLTSGWLARRPAAVSPQDVEALESNGYRVDQERLYVPVVLDDGRQAIVSFDRAAVKYSGWQY